MQVCIMYALMYLYRCACYLSIYLSIFLSIYLSICLSVYLSICLSVYLSICLSVYLSICLSVYLSICLSVYLSIYLSICLSVYLSICLSVYLSICLSVYLSIYLSVYLSICLSVYLSIYLSIYLFVLTCKNINIRMFAEQPRRPYCSEQDRLADVFSTDIFARKGGMNEACWLTRLEDPAALSTTTWVAFGCWHGRIWMLFCDHWFAFWVAKSTTFADLSKFFHDRRREQNFGDFWTVHIWQIDPHVQIIQPLYLL